jgi:hypothetical protein
VPGVSIIFIGLLSISAAMFLFALAMKWLVVPFRIARTSRQELTPTFKHVTPDQLTLEMRDFIG